MSDRRDRTLEHYAGVACADREAEPGHVMEQRAEEPGTLVPKYPASALSRATLPVNVQPAAAQRGGLAM
jgi:hypothetical protein